MKLALTKAENGTAIPAYDSDKEKWNKVGVGEIVEVRTVDQRNYKMHKKFFALIRFTFENLPERFEGSFVDEEDLREELLKAIGWKRTHKNFRGETVERAKSISFDSVGQERFEKIYSRTLDVVCRMIGVEETDIMDELLNFM